MTTRHLIITADDYGMCDSVNEAIDACLAAGALRSANVMANMPAVAAAATLRARFPGASLGVHWTLTQGRPLLPPGRVPSLVDARGEFHSFGELRRRALLGRVAMAEVRAELAAQHEGVRALIGRPDYWNTHEGFHVFPRLFPTCVALGRALGIPAMRSHRRVTVPAAGTRATYERRHPLYWLKGRLVALWAAGAERGGTLMPAGILTLPGFALGPAAVEAALARLDWSRVRGPVELTVHPATRVEPELFGVMTESRLREYQVFSDPGLAGRLRAAGVEPAGFEVLHADRTPAPLAA